jgi:hypothetical protein
LSGDWFLAAYRTTLVPGLRSLAITRSKIMGKAKETSKETKKQAAKSPKEKKAAKQAKKHASDSVPMVPAQRS